MGERTIRRWSQVHRWTSLVCTAFLLLLCLTGLPLIFREEIQQHFYLPAMEQVSAGTVAPSLDRIVAQARSLRPGEVVQLVFFDAQRPIISVATAPSAQTPFERAHVQPFDRRTGKPVAPLAGTTGFLHWMEELHVRLFLGLPGSLFLGAMGLVFLASLVSGVVLYAPFMRRLAFGTIRTTSRRVRWLDLHNLLGIATAAWLLVVGSTGVLNTLDVPIAGYWQATGLTEMTAAYRGQAAPTTLTSLDAAVATAERASPGMRPYSIAFPGNAFSSPHHYALFMAGDSDLTKYLLRPTLVDAQTGRLTAVRDMPLLVRTLFVSRPLHFGDYAGMPFKLLWAALDIVAILVLGSGLYLWLSKRPSRGSMPR